MIITTTTCDICGVESSAKNAVISNEENAFMLRPGIVHEQWRAMIRSCRDVCFDCRKQIIDVILETAKKLKHGDKAIAEGDLMDDKTKMNRALRDILLEASEQELIDALVEGSNDFGSLAETGRSIVRLAYAKVSTVFDEIAKERIRQDQKWGGPQRDDTHAVHAWMRVIKNYASWAEQMIYNRAPEKARKRLIQVAALAMAAVESIDRKYPD